MTRQIVFATGNPHKLAEIRQILPGRFQVLSLADIHFHADIVETASTLEGNALLKARAVRLRTPLPCFADDTGLEVLALGGAPGVRTARYALPDPSPEACMRKLLGEMQKKTDRRARFRTVIALIDSEGEHLFQGIVRGYITRSPRGTLGWGYDPVFQPEESPLTFAQMEPRRKNLLSHRARALRALEAYLGGDPGSARPAT